MNKNTLNLKTYLAEFNDVNISRQVPLIRWDSNWVIPKELQIEKYIIKKKFKGKIKSLLRYRLLGKLEGKNFNFNAKKWYSGNKLRGGLNYVQKDGRIWLVLKSNITTKIDIQSIRLIAESGWLKLQVPRDYIGIWFKYGRDRINFSIIPKIIKLNDLFWESFGILYGEMLRRGQQIAIANTEPNLINHILKFFDDNEWIQKADWNVTLAINSKKILPKEKNKILNNSKEYWKNNLSISNISIKNVYWYKWSSNLTPNFGEIDIRFYNLSIKKVISHLFEFVEKESILNEKFALPFLRGLMAAEGGADYVGDSIRVIRIASNCPKERIFYGKLFEVLGVNVKLYEERHNVCIFGIPNIIKCRKLDLLKLHGRKNNIFLQKFCISLSIRIFLLLSQNPLTKEEIISNLNLKNIKKIDHYIRSLMQVGLVTYKNGFFLLMKK